ncbi:MAG: CdaR family protein [Eubacteriales bacterium]|nr:CdaR family protein [Eubacteriales bacterium]
MSKHFPKLDPNLRLKIISVLIAAGIWYLINSFSDPAIRMTVNNVSVQILHGEAVENQGDVYTVLDNTDVIPVVTLQAKRSVIDKLEAKNIIATADVRDMEDNGSVKIILTTDKYSSSIERITGSISNVLLRVEPKETKSFALEVDTEGKPADGYILFDTSAEQNQVILSGPQSYVDSVARAAAMVDIADAERSIHSYPDIVLYDQEGNEISAEEMKEHKLHLNLSSVKVTATIYQTKEVPVICGGEVPLADGYELDSEPTAEPSSILVAGAAGILRETDSIEIPLEDIASEPVQTNMHKVVHIEKYLQDDVFPVNEEDGRVTVYLRVIKTETEEETEAETTDPSDGGEESPANPEESSGDQ